MLLAQTTQPTIPGLDPSWLASPGVREVIVVSVLLIVILTVFTMALTPLIVRACKSIGLIKRTWRDEMQSQIDGLKDATKTNATAVVDIAEKMEASNAVDSPDPAKIAPVHGVAITGTGPGTDPIPTTEKP